MSAKKKAVPLNRQGSLSKTASKILSQPTKLRFRTHVLSRLKQIVICGVCRGILPIAFAEPMIRRLSND